MEEKSKKRIIQNASVLYIRMLVTMALTLYTARVLLKALGIEDFGTYNLIGGIVAMFSALRHLFATSTQRFLNFEMGTGNKECLRQIFSMSINIQAVLCVIFFIIVELVGIWLISSKLAIPPDRLSVAYFILHFSVLTALVSIMTTPYDAVIMANERMSVFSIFAVVESILKFAIAYIVLYNYNENIDNLKLYAVLFFCISLIIRLMNSIYCRYNFPECKYMFFWDKKMFHKMGVFAGWNFVGSSAYSLAYEGVNILLNIFGGTAFNAARAITLQIQSSALNFVRNVFTASNPQIVKLYAQNKKDECFNLMFSSGKFSFYILLIISIPLFLYIDPLLDLWLDEVPPYTGVFSRLVLLYLLARVFHDAIDILYKASGRLSLYMIIDSSFFILMLLLSYILLKLGFPIQTPFIVMIGVEVLNLLAVSFLASKVESLNIILYLKKLIFPCFKVAVVSIIFSYLVFRFIHYESILTMFLLLIICSSIVVFVVVLLGMSRIERQMIKTAFFKNKH